jgi:hypothetical protein
MKREFGKLEWFGGNQDALNMYRMFVDLAHLWDDMVDGDKPLEEDRVNNAFLIALCYLPANPFYQQIQPAVLPMWLTVVSAYQTANHYEKAKDPHGLEIGHMLRYAAGNIIAYAVHVCVGADKAKEIMPEVWKHIVAERLGDYVKEVTA